MAPLFGRRTGSVSVVVSVTDANALFLADCLASLAGQRRPPDEVVLAVAGGAADTSAAVAAARESVAGAPWSPLVVEGPPDDGVARAAGAYLVLIEAGDVLGPAALRSLAGSLDRTGSDLALAGGEDRPRSTLTSAPEAVAGPELATAMLRADFWEAADLRADEGPVSPWLPAVHALMRSETFDVVGTPVRRGVRRGTGVPFNALPGTARLLPAVLPRVELVLAELGRPGLEGAREHVACWLVRHELSRYLVEAEACERATWQLLAGLARRLLDLLPADGLAAVPVEARLRVWLAAADRRADLERLNTARWNEEGDYPTVAGEGRVRAVLPVEDVPEHLLEPAPDELALVTQLRRARWDEDGRLELQVVAYVRRLGAAAGPARVRLSLVAPSGAAVELEATMAPAPEVNLLAAERYHDHGDGLQVATVDPARLTGEDSWAVHVDWERAGVQRAGVVRDVERRGSAAALEPRAGLHLDVRTATLRRDAAQEAPQPEAAAPMELTDLHLEGEILVVSGTAGGGLSDPAPATLRLTGPRGTATTGVIWGPDGFAARLPLRHDPWRLGPTPLPAGSYRLRLDGAAALSLGRQPAARTPYVERSPQYRVRVEHTPDGTPQLVLAPPLADDEAGPYAQQGLRRWYATDEHRLDPARVYLQSYAGAAVTDSPLAIHRELRRTRPDLRLVWGAADASVVVPEGAERVLLRSREWYSTIAASGHIVTNTDMDEWYRKRPGQRLLQTFHGYPAKAMGILAWQAKNFTPSMIERHLRRTAGTWDLLLTPHPSMDVHYREQYRYSGAVLNRGYPRDDELVGPDAPRLREETRRRLGLGDRTAVLFAPTWRDDLATNFRAAMMPSTLDVEAAAEALGEDYVILLRGHRFHRQRPEVRGRLLDVTSYPEINHLVLAADAAVLDYSSLRFDVALTRRPMIFLVPDLERYEQGVRGFLYDFRSSAPGPLVSSTAEVVAELADLEGVTRRFHADYERFHERFNTYQDGGAAARVVAGFFGEPPPQG